MTSSNMKNTKRFRYEKKRLYPSSSCMYPIEYTWMRNPTPVIIRSISEESGSIRKLMVALKLPALIQSNRVT
jgi:hypothetical protein